MTTAIDTNVVVALWDRDPTLSLAAQTALEAAFSRGSLVVSAPVFAELAKPWRHAGRAFQHYAERRGKQRDSGSRRILADFLIGHAQPKSYRRTLDERLYKAAFPTLTIETI
jgi:predicted nucleic acid-binding protein